MSHTRPLSPHLGIYRREWTMIYSILHRATGIALSGGLIAMVAWLLALGSGPENFALAQAILGHWVGQFFLLGWSFSLFYHLCNGIRHLAWDFGLGFGLIQSRRSGHASVIVAAVFTLIAWLVGYGVFG